MTMQQVHLRINDAATGKPTPVRLRITDADGTYYAPYGRLAEFATGVNQDVGGNVQIGAKKWAYIDGACEILLPPGPLHIEIAKGPEYKPIDETITLIAGKMALRFTIERWCDMRKQGWYSGDTRVHFMSPDAALLEGQAEDVAVVNLLAMESDFQTDADGRSYRAVPNIVAFSGQEFRRQAADCGVAVNTFNRCVGLGSLGLLHCHRVVYPLTFGHDDWTLADWCDQCHRKKGLVTWTDPQLLTADFSYGEPLADLILEKIDALELTLHDATAHSALRVYYQLLDAGFSVPLIGASGKSCNTTPLGAMRTYAYVPLENELNYTKWIDAVRAGCTFVTNGPLLRFTIDGEVPRTSLNVPSSKGTLQIRADARSWAPFDHLEILWNGDIIETAAPSGRSPCDVELEFDLPLVTSGWLAARCITHRTRGSDPLPLAHTSAVDVRVDGMARCAKPEPVQHFLNELDGMLRWATNLPRGQRLRQVIEQARAILAKKQS